jgi:hypothetical protein
MVMSWWSCCVYKGSIFIELFEDMILNFPFNLNLIYINKYVLLIFYVTKMSCSIIRFELAELAKFKLN